MTLARATDTDLAWLCGLLQGADTLYPTGSYAHSFGLEGLIEAGVVRDRATLSEFILHSALPGLEHTELPIVAHAWRALDDPDWTRIGELCVLSSALKPAEELRTAAEKIGRQRAELAARLRPGSIAPEFLRRVSAESWPHSAPVAAAVEARALGVPLSAALAAYTYSSVSALVAAALKLLRIGQNGAQSLLTEALAMAPDLIARSLEIPADEIGWFNPWLDIASAHHERANARMFIS